ncbi:hypothetical protein K450DRAFT_218879 [Umbelopsis ramanniana AG]|uniref:MutL C-terminal dimerisation domain-containing protein n=1 Tax=Umbelopsis ramanniana AG TaxID=1314678 RepID=A0AAD5HJ15_UMBRA|nr:uncharacterized protein K450DRAFT_218879 [Umbelopsis ramanniana AG]KAI8584251.1 hypothetical protein K450DRAFT_218879 [Umbelopsis ramanniana AG]
MYMLPTPILKLEKEEASALISNLSISSLTQCILELVYNALDAEATNISIGVNTENYYVNVQDNGLGIPVQDLENLARPNFTSKGQSRGDIHNRKTYGFRGEALSCISQIATLEVISRHASTPQTFHGIWRDGSLISFFRSTTEEKPSPGTTVVVRDLFHKHPIRRKQIEHERLRKMSASGDRTLIDIKRSIEKLALTRYDVAWTLNDLSSRHRILNMKAYDSPLKMFQCIYGHNFSTNCKEYVETSAEMRISGFLSLKLHTSKIHRYLYLNDHFVRFGPVYNIIDKLIRNANLHDAASGSKYTSNFPVYLIRVNTNVRNSEEKDMLEHYLNEDEESTTLLSSIKQFVLHILSISLPETQQVQIESNSLPLFKKRKASEVTEMDVLTKSEKKLLVKEDQQRMATQPSEDEQTILSTQDNDGTPQWNHAIDGLPYMNYQSLSGNKAGENYQYPKLFKNDGLPEALSTHQLTNARVIGQADRKFIAFSIPIPVTSHQEAIEKSMIIIADQHAVDERILLERMLKSILDPGKQVDQGRRLAYNGCLLLTPPRKLQVSSSEIEKAENMATSDSRHFRQLRSASKYFGQTSSSRTDDTHYIQITKIPRVISDRCATNSMLLKQIIYDHIAWMESQSQSQQIDELQPDDEFGVWSRHLRNCPRGIVDILKSKACRNAIMFNDSLTDQQCQKLVDMVSDCVFPFQCAHGRLSMVPLMKYNQYGGGRAERSNQQPSRRRTVNWRRFRRPQH